jgi:hypothetical protein
MICLSAVAALSQQAQDEPFTPKPLEDRIADREFPSFFKAWDGVFVNREDLTFEQEWALHDLSWTMAYDFGLIWDDAEYPYLATSFTDDSMSSAVARVKRLHEMNPNIVLLLSMYYRDLPGDWLPDDSPWWLLDKDGERIIGFEGSGEYVAYLLDYSNKGLQKHVAARAKAAIKTGLIDGIMLDWWDEDKGRIKLLRRVRRAIGKDKLIVVNSNQFVQKKSAKFVNGYFMECPPWESMTDWETFAETLLWAEKNLQKPVVNCFLTWANNYEKQPNIERACYAMALTHSNGYQVASLAGYKDYIPHHHMWFKNFGEKLGKPVAAAEKLDNGTWIREYEKGYAVYNPAGNKKVRIKFKEKLINMFTGKKSKRVKLPPEDGALLRRK